MSGANECVPAAELSEIFQQLGEKKLHRCQTDG